MIEFIIPVVLLSGGILCLIYPQQIGVTFCRFGKATWRASTFGLTDMRWFYPEEKAARHFRFMGVAFILFSIPWGIIAFLSVSGPGAFAAMRQSRGYLSEHYGSSGSGWSLSTKTDIAGEGDYFVDYRYGQHAGTLHASWQGGRYVFSEELKKPDKRTEPRRPASVSTKSPAPLVRP